MSYHTKEELENMLEDVINELELSESAVEKYGQIGVIPADLVRKVLDEKDLRIRALEANFVDASKSNCNIHGVIKWVATRDKMPPENTSVLCHNGYRIIQNSWMEHTSLNKERFKEQFTHWMPLPEPPCL